MKSRGKGEPSLPRGREIKVRIGKSFQSGREKGARHSYHSIRFGFRPRSMVNNNAIIQIKNDGSMIGMFEKSVRERKQLFTGTSTEAPPKHCVLVYDHKAGVFYIERLDTVGKFEHSGQEAVVMNVQSSGLSESCEGFLDEADAQSDEYDNEGTGTGSESTSGNAFSSDDGGGEEEDGEEDED
mmetsp:Transcript_9692/g.27196  ORF Transcript_9692/g.27196 Transcript_9692/m.27196 type:complete len:183 (+) Transcript_9692:28-576(+)